MSPCADLPPLFLWGCGCEQCRCTGAHKRRVRRAIPQSKIHAWHAHADTSTQRRSAESPMGTEYITPGAINQRRRKRARRQSCAPIHYSMTVVDRLRTQSHKQTQDGIAHKQKHASHAHNQTTSPFHILTNIDAHADATPQPRSRAGMPTCLHSRARLTPSSAAVQRAAVGASGSAGSR